MRSPVRRVVTVVALAALVGGCGSGSEGATDAVPGAQSSTTTLPGELPRPVPPPGPGDVDEYVELGMVEIPALSVTEKLLKGITLKTFDKGVGWWPGTAMPGGYGNMVLGGHRTTASKPFRHLDKLVPGDEIVVTTDSGRFTYEVRKTEIVDDSALWIVDQAPGHTATLFACHPVGSTAQRIVVFADLKGL